MTELPVRQPSKVLTSCRNCIDQVHVQVTYIIHRRSRFSKRNQHRHLSFILSILVLSLWMRSSSSRIGLLLGLNRRKNSCKGTVYDLYVHRKPSHLLSVFFFNFEDFLSFSLFSSVLIQPIGHCLMVTKSTCLNSCHFLLELQKSFHAHFAFVGSDRFHFTTKLNLQSDQDLQS